MKKRTEIFNSFLESLKPNDVALVEAIQTGFNACFESDDTVVIKSVFGSGYPTDISGANDYYQITLQRRSAGSGECTECLYSLFEAYCSNAVSNGWATEEEVKKLSNKIETMFSTEILDKVDAKTALKNAATALFNWYDTLKLSNTPEEYPSTGKRNKMMDKIYENLKYYLVTHLGIYDDFIRERLRSNKYDYLNPIFNKMGAYLYEEHVQDKLLTLYNKNLTLNEFKNELNKRETYIKNLINNDTLVSK